MDLLSRQQQRERRGRRPTVDCERGTEAIARREEDEPQLEDVRERTEHGPGGGQLEQRVADKAQPKEREGDVALERPPTQRDDREGRHVGQVADLVEALVVRDPAERVHQEQVAEGREQRDECSANGQRGTGNAPADTRHDDPLLGHNYLQ
ncbi:MAG: hypothetical protein M3Z65_01940 [Chloroflexota bacterium]|nr:hypothetical protein [Chloroflexota bacterium]